MLIQQRRRHPAQGGSRDAGSLWDGELILLTTRESRTASAYRFDMRWFIPQIVRYRRLIGEVLLLTLALNLLGLGGPLLFQTVIDRFWCMTAFLDAQRADDRAGRRLHMGDGVRLDAHAPLFRDEPEDRRGAGRPPVPPPCSPLPLGYFEGRRVGDTVTRVRQLETIREFLTNASLTVLIDPLFVVVFLGGDGGLFAAAAWARGGVHGGLCGGEPARHRPSARAHQREVRARLGLPGAAHRKRHRHPPSRPPPSSRNGRVAGSASLPAIPPRCSG